MRLTGDLPLLSTFNGEAIRLTGDLPLLLTFSGETIRLTGDLPLLLTFSGETIRLTGDLPLLSTFSGETVWLTVLSVLFSSSDLFSARRVGVQSPRLGSILRWGEVSLESSAVSWIGSVDFWGVVSVFAVIVVD